MPNPEISGLIQKANAEYLPWERVKYLKPSPVSPDRLWALLKLARTASRRNIPLSDSGGMLFGYWMSDGILRDLHAIDRDAGGSVSSDHPALPAEGRERYLISSLMEEAIASSQLEGAATTRRVAKRMLREGRKPDNYAEQMIANGYRTVSRIRELTNKPLTLEMLHELQHSITEGTLDDPTAAGRLRTDADQIMVIDPVDGTPLHTPPPAPLLPGRMQALLDFANQEEPEDGFIHPVIKAAILHFWVAYEHPYCDGNGRTARAVFSWYLLSRGYWLFEYLSISRIILHSRQQYVRAFLHAERDDLDLNYFLAYNLRAVRLAIAGLQTYLRRKQAEEGKVRRELRSVEGLNHRQRTLVAHALGHPDAVYTIMGHRNHHNVVYATARGDLLDLAARGYLAQRKQGRSFLFEPARDLSTKIGVR
jgi:Fic family protein